jgi:hypothetical protein
MPTTTIGRRVDELEALDRPGDYYLGSVTEQGVVKRAVWFLLPTHAGKTHTDETGHVVRSMFDRPTEGSGLHMVTEPPWTFTEHDDGSVEVRASILCGRTDTRPEGYWHGFLERGHVWRQV